MRPSAPRLWRYHKPDGLMTTHRDPQGRPTVFEKLPAHLPRVVSIGRLDLNSEGLLLLTNDGALARRLELPATGWLRRYRVRVHGAVEPKAWRRWPAGSPSTGVRYGPIEAGLDSRKGDNGWLTVALREGRNREVRRVMAHLGLHGDAADPRSLRPVPTRQPGARRGRGSARQRCCASNCRRRRGRGRETARPGLCPGPARGREAP